VDLLDRLVADKLAPIARDVSGEGWSWVETLTELDYETLSAFSRRYPVRAELPEANQTELDRLTGEYGSWPRTRMPILNASPKSSNASTS
jgi:hypothetical protein